MLPMQILLSCCQGPGLPSRHFGTDYFNCILISESCSFLNLSFSFSTFFFFLPCDSPSFLSICTPYPCIPRAFFTPLSSVPAAGGEFLRTAASMFALASFVQCSDGSWLHFCAALVSPSLQELCFLMGFQVPKRTEAVMNSSVIPPAKPRSGDLLSSFTCTL